MRGFSFCPSARSARVAGALTVVTAAAGLLAAGGSGAASAHVASAARIPASSAQPGSAGRPQSRPAAGPFTGVLSYLRSREGVAQVALFDKVTGRTYLLSDGTDTQYTASIVKADILAMWLRRYQSRPGTVPASIPFSVKYLMEHMITMSDNVAATSLFYFGGGCVALSLFNRLIPTRSTRVGCQTPTYYGWGNTTTTAADQVAIVRKLAYPNPVLTPSARDFGLHLMESVIPSQRWGITCGPWGTTCDKPDYATPVPGVTVAVKNGWKFVPTCTQQDESCPWQVNSIGWVKGESRDYVLAVLTTNDPIGAGTFGFDYGITTIQGVSQRVWANLAPSPAP
jgi:beta-lactamase class A